MSEGLKVGEVVREESAKFGRTVTDDDVEYVVWEFTGYPCFWPDREKSPEENLRMQLREYFVDPAAAHERRAREERELLAAFKNSGADGRTTT